MNETKYGKYLRQDFVEDWKFVPRLRMTGEDLGNVDFSMFWDYITEPFLMIDKPHTHDFYQFLSFLGHDPMNIRDFQAEVEFFLGEEGEKHVITCPTTVIVPNGLIHGPVNFKRVDKPVMFIECMLTPKYTKKVVE